MFGVSKFSLIGSSGFFLSDFTPGGDPWVLAFWMFQVVFAATAATIVSGAMAERTRFAGYLLYSVMISGLIYPVFGFNPGSTTAANQDIALIFVNTNLAAAAGAVFALGTSWFKFGKPEISMSLNGALAGLVSITAPCANVAPLSAVIIGSIAGVLVVYSVLFFEQIRVDDPVGAVSVHGVNGAWGTLAAGIFNTGGTSVQLIGVQLLGITTCFLWVFPTAFIRFKLIEKTIGLRVSAEQELEGLDYVEHGGTAYPDFEMVSYGNRLPPSSPQGPVTPEDQGRVVLHPKEAPA